MPQLGHGLVGLALGAATAGDARSQPLRHGWLGTVVLLAYLPDVLEWAGKHAGWRVPHSAPASAVAAIPCILLILAALRIALREKSRLILVAAGLAISSHTVLDLVDSGIPLGWPFSDRSMGPYWQLSLNFGTLANRLQHECSIFLPFVAVGLAIGVVRFSRHPRRAVAAVPLAVAACAAGIAGSVAGAALAVTALLGLAFLLGRAHLRPAHCVNLVSVLPVLLLGGAELYARNQVEQGRRWEQQGQFQRALVHYQRARRMKSPGTETVAIYQTALAYLRLHEDETSYQTLVSGLVNDPDNLWFGVGMAELYLNSVDTRYRRPRAALRLAEDLMPRAVHTCLRERTLRLRERARAAVEQLDQSRPGG